MLKKFTLLFIICMITICIYIPTYANNLTISRPSADVEIQRNDKYVYKYSYIDGVRCRRLWNETKGEWAEPGWTPCP